MSCKWLFRVFFVVFFVAPQINIIGIGTKLLKFRFLFCFLMAYSEKELKSNGDKASSCLRPFWIGNTFEKCIKWILTAASVKAALFWERAQCSLAEVYRRFGDAYWRNCYQASRRNIREGSRFYLTNVY
jgi:hypothetical protein